MPFGKFALGNEKIGETRPFTAMYIAAILLKPNALAISN